MKRNWRTLLPAYEAALRRYLKAAGTPSLGPALKLGKQAAAMGLDTLELAIVHEQTLIALMLRAGVRRDRIVKRARTFFAAANQPMEDAHRVTRDAVVELGRLNRTLHQRTRDLATSNRGLKQEIARRLVAEQRLRQSEQQSNTLLEQSNHLQKQLRHLSRQILSVQENERRRISRELHDVIAQVLTAINVRLTHLKRDVSSNTRGLAQNITRTQRLVERSVAIVHRFARELRPAVLDDLGIIQALHAHVQGFSKETGIFVRLTAFAGAEQLSIAKRTVLYRIAQEALTNVARHAHAGRVDMHIEKSANAISMRIKDDGRGFSPEQVMQTRGSKCLGLLGMRERVEMVGGTFLLESAAGQGTTIHMQIPIRPVRKKRTRP